MPDDPNKTGPEDGLYVSLSQEHERRYWTKRFGVDLDTLKRVVSQVGPRVTRIEQALAAGTQDISDASQGSDE